MTPEQRASRREELAARVKIIRESTLMQGGKVEGDPNKKYCWVYDNPKRHALFKTLGWTLCHSPTENDLPKTSFRRPDGIHQRVDVLLYEMPLDFYEAHEAYKELRRMDLLEATEKGFIDAATRNGVKTYKPRV